MAGKLLLEVVTPEKLLLSQQVDEVIAPGSEGEFGVLPGHCHFLSTLHIGELRYRIGDQTNHMAVLWGYAEVTPTKVTIMAEIAEKAEDIDVEGARLPSKRPSSISRLVACPPKSKKLKSVLKKPASEKGSPTVPVRLATCNSRSIHTRPAFRTIPVLIPCSRSRERDGAC